MLSLVWAQQYTITQWYHVTSPFILGNLMICIGDLMLFLNA